MKLNTICQNIGHFESLAKLHGIETTIAPATTSLRALRGWKRLMKICESIYTNQPGGSEALIEDLVQLGCNALAVVRRGIHFLGQFGYRLSTLLLPLNQSPLLHHKRHAKKYVKNGRQN